MFSKHRTQRLCQINESMKRESDVQQIICAWDFYTRSDLPLSVQLWLQSFCLVVRSDVEPPVVHSASRPIHSAIISILIPSQVHNSNRALKHKFFSESVSETSLTYFGKYQVCKNRAHFIKSRWFIPARHWSDSAAVDTGFYCFPSLVDISLSLQLVVPLVLQLTDV